MRSKRRAHLGGRSVGGKIQAMFARRQFEHGDCLSHRTLRARHTTQERNFGAEVLVGAVDGFIGDASDIASFSGLEARSCPESLTAASCDMSQSEE